MPDPLVADRTVTFDVSDKFSYDDNIFRLPPPNTAGVSFPGPGYSLGDKINTTSLGMDGMWSVGRQQVISILSIADNRFWNNRTLDNVSGSAKLQWDWVFTNLFSGQMGGDYARGLADFANTQFYAKDIVSDADYFASAIWDVGPHWSLKANARGEDATHSAVVRQGDDYTSRSGGFGAEYAISPTNSLGLDYQFTDVRFGEGGTIAGAGVNRDYDDNAITLNLKYAAGAVTALDAGGGYVKRSYTPGSLGPSGSGDFSGDVWRVTVLWQPTVQSGIKLKAWRDLRAYVDAESNYFVSRGTSIMPLWSPLERIQVTIEFSRENQDFIDSNLVIGSLPQRRDILTSAKAGVTYKFRRRVEIDAVYKYEKRTSDVDSVRYTDNLASLSLQYSF